MITPHKWAKGFARKHQEREFKLFGRSNRIEGDLREVFQDLDGEIFAAVQRLKDRVYRNGKVKQVLWNANKRSILNSVIQVPFYNFDKKIEALTKRMQREAFYVNTRDVVNLMKSIYPIPTKRMSRKQFQQQLQELQFQDAEAEIKFLQTGIEIKSEDVQPVFEAETTAPPATKPEALKLNVGTGKLNGDFKMFLERQLQVGLEPANLIKTFSTNHIAEMQRIVMKNVQEGINTRKTAKEFVDRIVTDMTTDIERKTLMFNTMRIIRTSHQRAAASAVSLYGLANRDLVVGLRRLADGRPCVACIFLDGSVHPPGSTISDHPQGMCVFVPILRTPEELGFDTSKIPARHREALKERVGRPTRPFRSRFYDMTEKEQRHVFSNDALYNLWKEERLPLGALVQSKNGFFVPKTFKQVQDEVDRKKIGGISHPKATFANFVDSISSADKTNLIMLADPVDRSDKLLVILPDSVEREDLIALNLRRDKLNPFSDGSEFLKNPPAGYDTRVQQYLEIIEAAKTRKAGISWIEFNEAARTLKLYQRMNTQGKMYWAVPKRTFEKLKLSNVRKKARI